MVVVCLSVVFAVTGFAGPHKPKLVVQITIDQMRGDFPMRYQDRWGKGGFRYLLKKGTHYSNAHFQHADTETPIGHSALFTGTTPSHNGIVAGNWYDKDLGRIFIIAKMIDFP